MNNPDVSIICPVYNTEKVLGKCIKSIIEQDIKDIEIILVNDGSTDHSLKICQKYASTDERIIVIDKPNGGRIQARKDGLLLAKGEYVFFIDCDDYIEKTAINTLLMIARKYNLDMVAGNYDIVYDNWGFIAHKPKSYETGERLLNSQQFLNICLTVDKEKVGGCFMWGTLYRRCRVMDALAHNDYLFPVFSRHLTYEDVSFNLAVASYLHSGWITNTVIYHYRYGGQSLTGYYDNLTQSAYYFDYSFDLCVEKKLMHLLPDVLCHYENMVCYQMVSYLHHRVGSKQDLIRLLQKQFSDRKITQWARQYPEKLPETLRNKAASRYIIDGDNDTLFEMIDEREGFLRKHHYWKMKIMKVYQVIVNSISYYTRMV